MKRTEVIQAIKNKFQEANLCVLSTVSSEDGSPQGATMKYTLLGNLQLILGSLDSTRKNHNMKTTPKVAITLGWSKDDWITIQYEGTARLLQGEEREQLSDLHCKNSGSQRYRNHPSQEYFLVTPTWVRYSDWSDKESLLAYEIDF